LRILVLKARSSPTSSACQRGAREKVVAVAEGLEQLKPRKLRHLSLNGYDFG
jgi:hypothetical protein